MVPVGAPDFIYQLGLKISEIEQLCQFIYDCQFLGFLVQHGIIYRHPLELAKTISSLNSFSDALSGFDADLQNSNQFARWRSWVFL